FVTGVVQKQRAFVDAEFGFAIQMFEDVFEVAQAKDAPAFQASTERLWKDYMTGATGLVQTRVEDADRGDRARPDARGGRVGGLPRRDRAGGPGAVGAADARAGGPVGAGRQGRADARQEARLSGPIGPGIVPRRGEARATMSDDEAPCVDASTFLAPG